MYKVVVIDDEAIVRNGIVLETNWKALNCVIVGEAANGLDGLEVIKKYEPDLIISDIRMPGLDGLEMLRQLRADGCKAAVIYLTAFNEFSYAQKAIKLSAADYLLKPFEDGELEKTVEAVLEREYGAEKSTSEVEDSKSVLSLRSGDKSRYVMDALDYIDAHYTDTDINIGKIAESLGLSEGHLSHIFKKETDYTVNAYITRYRIRAALRLLKGSRYKVYEVSSMVGYKDINYFSQTFKKLVGVTPSDYQDRAR